MLERYIRIDTAFLAMYDFVNAIIEYSSVNKVSWFPNDSALCLIIISDKCLLLSRSLIHELRCLIFIEIKPLPES